jgi:hypothetical protein
MKLRKLNRERRNKAARAVRTMGRDAYASPRHGAEGPWCPICSPHLHGAANRYQASAFAAAEQVADATGKH